MADDTPEAIQSLLKAAFLALVYEYVDHAAAILARPAVAQYLQLKYNSLDVEKGLREVSRTLASQHRRVEWRQTAKWVAKRALGRR